MWKASERAFAGGIAWLLGAAVLQAGAPAAQDSESVTQAARRIQWSAPSVDALHRLLSDAGVVTRFLKEIEGAGDPADALISEVKEYRIMDLNGDGVVELVALADVTGRAFFNNVVVVYQADSLTAPRKPLDIEFDGFLLRNVHGYDIESLDDVLKDLDEDGVYEVVVNGLLDASAGPMTQPRAMLPEIYKWTGDEYERASTHYGWYYRDVVLPALERDLQRLEGLQVPAPSERAEHRARRNKIAREIAEAKKRASTRQH